MDSACEICGDLGGASSMVICENHDSGCIAGRHTYCFTPTITAPPTEAWYCTFCNVAVEAARAVQQREEAEQLSALPPPTKRQRTQPDVQPRAAAAPPRATADTFSLALEQLKENDEALKLKAAAHESSQRRRYDFGLRKNYAQEAEYSFARCQSHGAQWTGNLVVATLQGGSTEVECTAYPMPASNPLSAAAARALPAQLHASQVVPVASLEAKASILCREACLVLGSATGGMNVAWGRLLHGLAESHSMLRVEQGDGTFLLLLPNPLDGSSTLLLLMATAQHKEEPRHKVLSPAYCKSIVKRPGTAGMLRAASKPLSWVDGSIEDTVSLPTCELRPGTQYSHPDAHLVHTQPAAELRGCPPLGADTHKQDVCSASADPPLKGLRIALMELSPRLPVVKALQELGAIVVPRAFPSCQELIVIGDRVLSEGLETLNNSEGVTCDIARCLAAPPALGMDGLGAALVFQGTSILQELVKLKRVPTADELRARRSELGVVFPAGMLVLMDVETVSQLELEVLQALISQLSARKAAAQDVVWRLALPPADLAAWEEACSRGQCPPVNLQAWQASGVSHVLKPEEISTNSRPDPPALVRHAVKAARHLRGQCRLVFVATCDATLSEAASHQTSILAGSPSDALKLLSVLP